MNPHQRVIYWIVHTEQDAQNFLDWIAAYEKKQQSSKRSELDPLVIEVNKLDQIETQKVLSTPR